MRALCLGALQHVVCHLTHPLLEVLDPCLQGGDADQELTGQSEQPIFLARLLAGQLASGGTGPTTATLCSSR